MFSDNNESLNEVLSYYSIDVMGIRNETYKDKKGVWWIQTPKGYKILKKMSNSESTIKFTISAVHHLIDNGVRIPLINQTKTGSDYVKFNDVCYILSDAIDGKNPSYSSQNELAMIVKELARFHKASNGFFPPADSKPKKHLGTWIQNYTEQVEDMNRFYIAEHSKVNNNIGKFILQEFPYFYDRAKKFITLLDSKEYFNWVDKSKNSGGLCHQDFASGNLLISKAGFYILDIDSITIDIPARDLRKLLNKIMKKSDRWDINLTKKVFDYYQSENPLTSDEWLVVKYDLMFPHLFISAMNKYYYQRDKAWDEIKYFEKLKVMADFEKTKSDFIDKILL